MCTTPPNTGGYEKSTYAASVLYRQSKKKCKGAPPPTCKGLRDQHGQRHTPHKRPHQTPAQEADHPWGFVHATPTLGCAHEAHSGGSRPPSAATRRLTAHTHARREVRARPKRERRSGLHSVA